MEFNPIEIIEKHIDIIDQNKFDDLYDILEVDIPPNYKSVIGNITKILEDAGINPLNHLDYIPNYYNSYREDLKGDIYLPDNIKFIGTCAFSFCQNITKVIVPETCKEIYPMAFGACTGLEFINFPSDLERIGSRAFFNCRQLNPGNWFPEGLKVIGDYAFSGCPKIKEVTMPLNLQELGSHPFGNRGTTNPMTLKLHRGTKLFLPYNEFHFEYID